MTNAFGSGGQLCMLCSNFGVLFGGTTARVPVTDNVYQSAPRHGRCTVFCLLSCLTSASRLQGPIVVSMFLLPMFLDALHLPIPIAAILEP
jgi:hypothetical protein